MYEFACLGCGAFELRRPMAASGDPAHCPACAGLATRRYSAPATTRSSPGAIADAVDERSRNAPERVQRAVGHGDHAGHRHGASGRPWQISH